MESRHPCSIAGSPSQCQGEMQWKKGVKWGWLFPCGLGSKTPRTSEILSWNRMPQIFLL